MVDYFKLDKLLNKNVKCFIFDSIPSTNSYLTNLPFSNDIKVCVAKHQTLGKGQHNRKWISKKDSSIIFSIHITLPLKTSLDGLSLMVGLAILETLELYNINKLQLKWPNDIYFGNSKLAGVLIENSLQKEFNSVVIGVGINSKIDSSFDFEVPAVAINQIVDFEVNNLFLTADLINKILEYCDIFTQKGFKFFYKKWNKYDYLLGKKVIFKDNEKTIKGKCQGVTNQGLLFITGDFGTKEVYSSNCLSFLLD